MIPVPTFKYELLNRIRQRLRDDWILIDGPIESLARLEHGVYTPGTPKNENFEICLRMTKDHRLMSMQLARKTEDLRAFLRLEPDHFANLIQVSLGEVVDGICPVAADTLENTTLEEYVEAVVQALREVLA